MACVCSTDRGSTYAIASGDILRPTVPEVSEHLAPHPDHGLLLLTCPVRISFALHLLHIMFNAEMCPYGINPTPSQQEDKKIRLRITTTGGASIKGGALTLTFQAHTVEFEMPLAQVTSEVCTTIFRRFQNLGDLVSNYQS